jgi:hypothetical protein
MRARPSAGHAWLAALLALGCGAGVRRKPVEPVFAPMDAGEELPPPTDAGAEDAGLSPADAESAEALVDLVPAAPDAGEPLLPGAVLAADARELALGGVEAEVAGEPRAWIISNRGETATGVLVLGNTDPAQLLATSTCPPALGPGGRCTITLLVHPRAAGPLEGSLTLAATPGGEVRLAVSGTALHRLTVARAGAGTGTITSTPPGIECGATCTGLFTGEVTLHARTSNGSDSFFSGWEGPCEGPARDCQVKLGGSLSATARFSAMTHNLVFVTSKRLPSTLGGAAAYDGECNKLASAAGINDNAGGAYVAMVSSPWSLARSRLGSARGWVRLDGKPFADSLDSLFGPRREVFHSISFFETGEDPGEVLAMTGTAADGTSSLEDSCQGWTVAGSGSAHGGGSKEGPNLWTESWFADCALNHVVCMGKKRGVPSTVARREGKRVWLSAAYVPGSVTPDAHCRANRPPGVSEAGALVSTTHTRASQLLVPDATYVRPDGVVVGTGATIGAGKPESGIWQEADGTYAGRKGHPEFGNVWTGSAGTPDRLGTAESTCADWTDPAGSGAWGDLSAGPRFWNTSGSSGPRVGDGTMLDPADYDCTQKARLYCIER